MSQHSGLTVERWNRFAPEQRILMIGNEMQRATRLMGAADRESLGLAYERVLRLTDLTVATADRHALRRELLRWRDLVATLYVSPDSNAAAHAEAFRTLLLLTPASADQLPYVTL